MRILSRAAAASVAVFFLSAPLQAREACQGGEIVIKFSHVVSPDNPKGRAATLLEKRVNEEMDGKACMIVYPNSQLYDDNKVLEALLLGDVQMAAPALSKFEKYTKKFRLFVLPFLFADIDAVERFQNSDDGQRLKASALRGKGFLGLAYWHNGMKQLSADKPLLMPADAKGLKFRIMQSDVLQAQFEAIGAVPQKMAFTEVYGALQTGVVDGQENTWANIYTKKFFEVQDGTTESNHGLLDYLVVTSSAFWDGLPDDVRDQLATILKEVTETQNDDSKAINEKDKQLIIDAGYEIRQLLPEQRAAWVNAMRPVWDRFSGDIGEDLIATAQSYNPHG